VATKKVLVTIKGASEERKKNRAEGGGRGNTLW